MIRERWWWNGTCKGKKTSPIATLSTPNSTWTDVVSNPGLQSERPVTNHPNHVEVPLKLTTQPPHTICCWIPLKLSMQNHRTNALLNTSTRNAQSSVLCSGQCVLSCTLLITAGSVRSAVRSSLQRAVCAQLYTPHLSLSLVSLATAQWHPLQTAAVSVSSADQLSCLQMWSFASKRGDSNTTKLYPWQKFRAHESGNAAVQNLTVFPDFT